MAIDKQTEDAKYHYKFCGYRLNEKTEKRLRKYREEIGSSWNITMMTIMDLVERKNTKWTKEYYKETNE